MDDFSRYGISGMYYDAWLVSLKPQDDVVVYFDDDKQEYPRKVASVTTTQIVLDDGTKITRSSGYGRSNYRIHLVPASESERNHIMLASEVSRIQWFNLTDNQLQAILNIVKGTE